MAHRMPLIQWIATGATIGFLGLTGTLPLGITRWLGRQLGRAAYYVVPRVRREGFANLERAYGRQMPAKDRAKLLKRAVQNVGIVAAEFRFISRMDTSFVQKYVIIEGVEHLPRDRGAIIIGGHLGNWEWMAPAMAAMGYSVAEVVRPLDHKPLDRYVDRIRSSGRIRTIPKDDAAMKILALLRQNYCVGILIDQSQRQNAVPTTFFGHPCWSTAGPVMLALRARVPIVPVSMTRMADGRYRLQFHPEVELRRSGDWLDDLAVNVQRCQDVFEHLVRTYPDQWLWIHRRWAKRARLEQEWAARVQVHEKSTFQVDAPPGEPYDRGSGLKAHTSSMEPTNEGDSV